MTRLQFRSSYSRSGLLLGALVSVATLLIPATTACVAADTYTVTLDEAARSEAASGRIMLFFIAGNRGRPADAPFFFRPQPIASVAVKDLAPGASVTIRSDGEGCDELVSWPAGLDAIDGPVRVQAVLDAGRTQRSWLDEPGNVLSNIVDVTLTAGTDDHVELTLSEPITVSPPENTVNVKWVTLRSELLSAHYGFDVFHRAGVALPRPWLEETEPRRPWPAVYVVPGFGGRDAEALEYGETFAVPNVEDVAPMAVHIVLDPESPLGHHGFVDSAANGPRGTALVKEFIPYLEQRFGLSARPEARIATGHSSGAWTSLWLVLTYPETFGACWATAPDPVDFHAFQTSDLYADASLYADADGNDRPSMRRTVGRNGETAVLMTVRQEGGMEHAIDPNGGSGQQWDAYDAMFSPLDDKGRPRAMFDAVSGRIDREVVAAWADYDIARLVASDWAKFGPIVTQRIRLFCGEEDSFYLENAVRRFKTQVEAAAEESGGWQGSGFVRLVPFATHGNLLNHVFADVNAQMRGHLEAHGLNMMER